MNNYEENVPILKTFIVKNNYYVYDTYRNQILCISKELFREINTLQKVGIHKYLKNPNSNQDVCTLINQGFFKSNFIKNVAHPDTRYVKELIQRGMNQLVLEVTSACNFKCQYCHQTNISNRNVKNMTFEIAKRGVDLLYEHSKDANEIIITFYGGEPLINFDLIKSIVEYSNQKFLVKPLVYNMTTNASLISDEILDFLVNNNFSILISLDGDKKIQNVHRKFYIDGGDTFQVVWSNITKIKNRYPTFFKNNIRFNAVAMPDQCIDDILSFFSQNDILTSSVSISNADLSGMDYTSSPIMQKKRELELTASSFEDNYVDYINKIKNKSLIMSSWHHSGPCVPAVRRLFISVDGNFYPCEKVDCNIACIIGNINYGLDLNKIIKILNVGSLTKDECKKCWALRFCSICVRQCTYDGDLSRMMKLDECKRQKENTLSFLKKYIEYKTN